MNVDSNNNNNGPLRSILDREGKITEAVPLISFLVMVVIAMPIWAITVVPITICYQLVKAAHGSLFGSKGPKKESIKKDDVPFNVRTTEEGKQIPIENGGITKRYQWTQTLEEASVILKVPSGTRGKDLDVSFKSSFLSIRFKNEQAHSSPILLEGDLFEKIRIEESTWSLEGAALLLTLDKRKQSWWETVIIGDEIIDTTMVDSTRKIGTYDEATQAYIRKILFDQRQERLGKPTSNEILGANIPKSLPPGIDYIDQAKLDEIKKMDKIKNSGLKGS